MPPEPRPATEAVFRALAHPARRAVVERLGHGPAAATTLAEPADMALPSFMQHLQLLEEAGVVRSVKEGRTRTYHLVPDGLRPAEGWLARQRRLWDRRLDQFDDYVSKLEEERS